MNNLEYFLRKHSPTILSIASGIGLVTTTILSIKATTKAVKILEDEKRQRSKRVMRDFYADNEKYQIEDVVVCDNLSLSDTIKLTWKPYIPTFLSGFTTLICIFGNNYLNKRIQMSLISAYGVLNESYKNYIATTEELFGDKAKEIKNKMIKNKIDPYKIQNQHKRLFFDDQSLRYFESTDEDVLAAEDMLNQEYAAVGHVSINDFYKYLGMEPTPYGDRIGWSDNGNYPGVINFDHESIKFDDGLECTVIVMDEPIIDYYKY